MKLHVTACAVVMTLGLTGCGQKPASDDKQALERDWPQSLLSKYDCLKCHTPATRLVGPAYRDVALKYKDDPGAIDHILQILKKGGKGTWGDVPMPPHPQIPEEDARKLAEWIMNTK